MFARICLVSSSLLLSFPAAAVMVCTHGNTAQVEFPDNSSPVVFKGWGYDSNRSGLGQWLHYSLPTLPGQDSVQKIQVRYYMSSVDNFIDSVHIYDAERKVYNGNDMNWSQEGWATKTLNLPSALSVARGLGISIHTGSGVESMGHRIIISSVCADLI